VLGIEAIRDQINQAMGTEFTGPEFGLFSIAFSLTSFVLFSLLIPDQPTSTNGISSSEEVA
jgi:formate hydrogenlyase subunit 4